MKFQKIDKWIALTSLLLFIMGLITLSTIAPGKAVSQLLFFGVSVVFFFIFSQIDFVVFTSIHVIFYLITILLLISPFIFGIASRGAYRWIQLDLLSFQPSEFVKPFLILTFSVLATSKHSLNNLYLFLSVIIPSGLIFLQPDLGTSLVVFVGWFTIMLTRFSIKYILVIILGLSLLSLPIYTYLLQDYQKDRVATFVNPYNDPLNKGYHVIQSVITVGSGGLLGRGLGRGTQSSLRFLPEYHTDFIFASLSESLGFFGALTTLTLYIFLLWRIYKISQDSISPTGSVYCVSALALLSFQIFINIGMNIGLAPVTGITLPFLSYGGSSLVSTGILLGFINTISKSSRIMG